MSGQGSTAIPASSHADAEYSKYVDHTAECSRCKRDGRPCPAGKLLALAWREARR